MWKIISDQTGRELAFKQPPTRIISLVPSQTELLFDLGLESEVVGITKFCVHPEGWFRSKPRVGGTKNLNIEKIRSLAPDLVIANKEENNREDVEAILPFCPVWTSDIVTIADALDMIGAIGDLTDKTEKARQITDTIRSGFRQVPRLGKRAAYLIWKKPYMAAGGDTFINSMMELAGLTNVFNHLNRYPEVKIDNLQEQDIDLLLLSSEPYPFKISDIEDLSQALPHTRIVSADGEMFSWYGSRLQYFPGYICSQDWA